MLFSVGENLVSLAVACVVQRVYSSELAQQAVEVRLSLVLLFGTTVETAAALHTQSVVQSVVLPFSDAVSNW